jgi:hypothetical protein
MYTLHIRIFAMYIWRVRVCASLFLMFSLVNVSLSRMFALLRMSNLSYLGSDGVEGGQGESPRLILMLLPSLNL